VCTQRCNIGRISQYFIVERRAALLREAAIRNVIAVALMEHDETNWRGADALFAMRQAEAIVKALAHTGYEIRRRS
jgi:hypothetical protein